jgi:hypothetical protein
MTNKVHAPLAVGLRRRAQVSLAGFRSSDARLAIAAASSIQLTRTDLLLSTPRPRSAPKRMHRQYHDVGNLRTAEHLESDRY